MLKSIKIKFALVFSSVLIIILVAFSTSLFSIINQKVEQQILDARIEATLMRHPALGEYYKGQHLRDQGRMIQVVSYFQEEVTEKYNRTLVYLLIPTGFASLLVGYITALFLVRPIDKLAKDVKQLSMTKIDKRLPNGVSSTEIEYLRDSFNELLDGLEGAFNAQEEFIQDAAHELRTPLASMRATLDNLKNDKQMKVDDYKKAVDVLSRMNQSLVRLSEDLFYLDRRGIPESSTKIDVGSLLEEVLEGLHSLLVSEQVIVKKQFENELQVVGNSKYLARAFKNIVENSVKYRRENLTISIRLTSVQDTVHLVIKDNGRGISKAALPKIFDRFYRGDEKKSVDGSGLGLAIVKKIVSDHNGEILVTSRVGKGSSFTIILPRA